MSIDDILQPPTLYSGNFQSRYVDGVDPSLIGSSQAGRQFTEFGVDFPLVVADSSDDLQRALDYLKLLGGGVLRLLAGTYTIKTALTAYGSITIEGVSSSATIIDFASTAANLSFTGTNVYSTGTITAITGGVTVTGSGTSWLANATAGQHLFLGTRWYLIAAVTANDTLILAEAYGDDVTLPASYRIATVQQNITIKNVLLKNSTGTGIVLTDCRRITLDTVITLDCNKGKVFTNCSEINADRVLAVSHTSNGFEFANVGLSDLESVNSIGNGGVGYLCSNFKTISLSPCIALSNTGDGWNMTTCVDVIGQMDAISNGGQGIELVATNDNVVIRDAIIKSNTSDGVKFTATSDNCRVYGCRVASNGGYGVNIAASTCDDNIVANNSTGSNTSGNLNDSGTGTVVSANTGI